MVYQPSPARCANDPFRGEKNGGTTGMTSVIVQKGAQTLPNDHKGHITIPAYPILNNP
uniref:Uncharacterized protein n=1 Tax=uncultured nuHF2 cluster bacterium HF0130_29D04 TaxID=723587 RepID=E7C3C1_9BACT|nr:hypothetical protein [uncultured nuHF2 cluster bacterium HF0130_29D04]